MCHISGHQDVYVTSTVVTDQIYFPRTLTDGSGAPTSVPCLQQTPAEVSMTGLIREAWEFNNRITERRSSSTETQSPAWLCSTTIMEMVSELLLFNCEWAVSGKFYKLTSLDFNYVKPNLVMCQFDSTIGLMVWEELLPSVQDVLSRSDISNHVKSFPVLHVSS